MQFVTLSPRQYRDAGRGSLKGSLRPLRQRGAASHSAPVNAASAQYRYGLAWNGGRLARCGYRSNHRRRLFASVPCQHFTLRRTPVSSASHSLRRQLRRERISKQDGGGCKRAREVLSLQRSGFSRASPGLLNRSSSTAHALHSEVRNLLFAMRRQAGVRATISTARTEDRSRRSELRFASKLCSRSLRRRSRHPH